MAGIPDKCTPLAHMIADHLDELIPGDETILQKLTANTTLDYHYIASYMSSGDPVPPGHIAEFAKLSIRLLKEQKKSGYLNPMYFDWMKSRNFFRKKGSLAFLRAIFLNTPSLLGETKEFDCWGARDEISKLITNHKRLAMHVNRAAFSVLAAHFEQDNEDCDLVFENNSITCYLDLEGATTEEAIVALFVARGFGIERRELNPYLSSLEHDLMGLLKSVTHDLNVVWFISGVETTDQIGVLNKIISPNNRCLLNLDESLALANLGNRYVRVEVSSLNTPPSSRVASPISNPTDSKLDTSKILGPNASNDNLPATIIEPVEWAPPVPSVPSWRFSNLQFLFGSFRHDSVRIPPDYELDRLCWNTYYDISPSFPDFGKPISSRAALNNAAADSVFSNRVFQTAQRISSINSRKGLEATSLPTKVIFFNLVALSDQTEALSRSELGLMLSSGVLHPLKFGMSMTELEDLDLVTRTPDRKWHLTVEGQNLGRRIEFDASLHNLIVSGSSDYLSMDSIEKAGYFLIHWAQRYRFRRIDIAVATTLFQALLSTLSYLYNTRRGYIWLVKKPESWTLEEIKTLESNLVAECIADKDFYLEVRTTFFDLVISTIAVVGLVFAISSTLNPQLVIVLDVGAYRLAARLAKFLWKSLNHLWTRSLPTDSKWFNAFFGNALSA